MLRLVVLLGALCLSACGPSRPDTPLGRACEHFLEEAEGLVGRQQVPFTLEQCVTDEHAFNTLRGYGLTAVHSWHVSVVDRINRAAEIFGEDRYPDAPILEGPLPFEFTDEINDLPQLFKLPGRLWVSGGADGEGGPSVLVLDSGGGLLASANLDGLPRRSWSDLDIGCGMHCTGSVTIAVENRSDFSELKEYVAVDMQIERVSLETLEADWLARYQWDDLVGQRES